MVTSKGSRERETFHQMNLFTNLQSVWWKYHSTVDHLPITQSRVLSVSWRQCNTQLGEQHQYLWDLREDLREWTERDGTLKTHTILTSSSLDHRWTSEAESWVGRRTCEAWVACRVKIAIGKNTRKYARVFPVAYWYRIHLPMQEMWV